MGEYSKVERDGHILIVTVNRPERMNAMHSMAHLKWPKFLMILKQMMIFGLQS